MPQYEAPNCLQCRHFQEERMIQDRLLGVCAAFPNGIPDEIFFQGNPHTKPFKGDHGITFERTVTTAAKAEQVAQALKDISQQYQ